MSNPLRISVGALSVRMPAPHAALRRRVAPPARSQPVDAAIAALLERDPPCANALVLQIVEDASIATGGPIWLATLTSLLAPFGVSERLMRTSVYRLVGQGELYSVREGRRSACGIAGAPRQANLFENAAPPDGSMAWTLVMGRSGRFNAAELAVLRKQLRHDWFRQLVPGVFARPGRAPATLPDDLQRLGLGHRLWVCQVTELPATGQRPLAELVQAAWDLAPAGADYHALLERYATLPACLRAAPPLTPRQAFMLRTLLLCDWRRAQRRDPQLPPSLLPPDWPRARCAALCSELESLTAEGASRHLT